MIATSFSLPPSRRRPRRPSPGLKRGSPNLSTAWPAVRARAASRPATRTATIGEERVRMPVERAPGGTSLIDVLDRILDKGIVIDAWVRISLVGIDLITVEARIVVASI